MTPIFNCIIHEPESEYHAQSKSGDILSSHMLARFQEMPYKYFATITGRYKEPDKAEYALGSAAHKLILEGREAFELEGVKCQIRMDYFDPEIGIIDLKTCRDIRFFEYDMRSFGYAFQMAFYRAVLRQATGTEYPVYMVAIDKTEFHVAGYWLIPGAELDIAERINAAAIRRLKECRETGIWPTGYERKQIFTLNK